ncbi:helix-turn-helix domain-containing protein [Desertifilum sp. FACHB-1129]
MTAIVNYCYRIYPDATQEQTMLHWLEISRSCVQLRLTRNQRLGKLAQM